MYTVYCTVGRGCAVIVIEEEEELTCLIKQSSMKVITWTVKQPKQPKQQKHSSYLH